MSLSPYLLDGILVLVLVEFLVLTVFLVWRGRGDVLLALFFFLVSGGLLLVGMRVIVAGGAETTVMAILAMSFPAHIAALVLGWRLLSKR